MLYIVHYIIELYPDLQALQFDTQLLLLEDHRSYPTVKLGLDYNHC